MNESGPHIYNADSGHRPDATTFIRGKVIAQALDQDKKTIHTRALREGWTMQQRGNRWEYQPPEEVAVLLQPRRAAEQCSELHIRYADLPADSKGRATALRREEAVKMIDHWLPLGKVNARRQVVAMLVTKYADFNISTRSLERWEADYRAWGIDGLVEQKLGKVGRKALVVPQEFVALGKALVHQHGSLAAGSRELMRHEDLPAHMRVVLHEGHASKSYVNKSIRAAIRPAPLTAELARGPRAARLSDRFTPGNYDEVKAGQYYVSDDMTSNVICWTEWPNALGWRIGQAQVLPVMDIKFRWLNVRVIMRHGGQYNASDDIWGVFGDTFDTFGLPEVGFVLEGGHWQAKAVVGQPDPHKGHRTGLTDDERIGGLASLGLKVFRSYDPRSKDIETAFNQLQYLMDAFPGYAGRDQRTQIPERLKKQLALLNAKHPVHHPREFLPHISQLADHVQGCMENLNNQRNDGKILRGHSPLEAWMAEAGGRVRQIPDSSKWLYRSAMSVSEVTKNGARVTLGSGKKMMVYYYDNPALLTPLKGQKVVIYWNHRNPDADACIMANVKGRRTFLGMAQRVKELSRFGGSETELSAEAARKREAMMYSRTELRSMQPHLTRQAVPIPADAASREIGAAMSQASERAEKIEEEKTDLKRIAKRFQRRALAATEEPEMETISRGPNAPAHAITDEELNEL